MLSAVQEKKHFGEGSDSQTTSSTRKMQLVKNEAGICEEKALPSLPFRTIQTRLNLHVFMHNILISFKTKLRFVKVFLHI